MHCRLRKAALKGLKLDWPLGSLAAMAMAMAMDERE
jgi:hypothetical protein